MQIAAVFCRPRLAALRCGGGFHPPGRDVFGFAADFKLISLSLRIEMVSAAVCCGAGDLHPNLPHFIREIQE